MPKPSPFLRLDDALRHAVLKETSFFASKRGSICIEVGDTDALTLRFGNAAAPLTHGYDDEADLKIYFSEGALASFMGGDLDIDAAIDAGEFLFFGDTKLFAALGQLLRPPKNPLSVQFLA